MATWCLGGSIFLLLVAGCSKGKAEIPELSDDPVTAPVILKDMPESVPAYGIVSGGALEVNVEKEDAPEVSRGQRAIVLIGQGQNSAECRVTNILQNANIATGLAIAWLKPVSKTILPDGDFVSAQIILRIKHHVPTVPQQAIFVRDGKTMVIVKQAGEDVVVDKDAEPGKDAGMGKTVEARYLPVPVQTGIVSDSDVEILSGLRPQDEVVVQAGIGYVYPEFRSQAGD